MAQYERTVVERRRESMGHEARTGECSGTTIVLVSGRVDAARAWCAGLE